jgi:hypothetical protein
MEAGVMRFRGWHLLVLLAVLVPTVGAQGGAGAEARLVQGDPAGDVRVQPSGSEIDAAVLNDVDLLELWVGEENDTHLMVGYALAAEPTDLPQNGGHHYEVGISFAIGFRQYEVRPASVYCPSGHGLHSLQAANPASYRLETCVDASGGDRSPSFSLPRVHLQSSEGYPLRAGLAVENLTVEARRAWGSRQSQDWSAFMGVMAYDRVPDSGGLRYESTYLGEGFGDLLLTTRVPLRPSNGEATTYVFNVSVKNIGEVDRRVQIEAEDVPAGWSVESPSLLQVPAEGSRNVAVAISAPFAHEHGSTAAVTLVARDLENPQAHWSALALGAAFLPIPQPAGHHNEIQFHSIESPFGSEATALWINTLDSGDDPEASEVPVGASVSFGDTAWKYSWTAPLQPALALPLDFILNETGLLTLELTAANGAPNVPVSAKLEISCDGPPNPAIGVHCSPMILAEGTATATLASGQPSTVEVALEPLAEADLVPVRGGANMRISFSLESGVPLGAAEAAELTLDPRASFLRLPLQDYHDANYQEAFAPGDLLLSATQPSPIKVNPGDTVRIEFQLTTAHPAHVQIAAGGAAEWLVVPEQPTADIVDSATVAVLLTAPEAGLPGDHGSFYVLVDEPATGLTAAALFSATLVDPASEDIPSFVPTKKVEAPVPVLLPLLGMALALAFARMSKSR